MDGYAISVFYFRAGYTPDDYPTEKEWGARSLIESSTAIKCPSIAYHLVGAKKVQQTLARGGDLEIFLNPADAAEVRKSFAGLWSLGPDGTSDEETKRAIKDAKLNPDAYVIKPQREGGGNNIYGKDVKRALEGGMAADELAAHILMQRIQPARDNSVLVKDGKAREGEVISELGISACT